MAGGGVDIFASSDLHPRQMLRVLGQPHTGEALIAAAAGLTKSAKCSFSWSRKRYEARRRSHHLIRPRKCPVSTPNLARVARGGVGDASPPTFFFVRKTCCFFNPFFRVTAFFFLFLKSGFFFATSTPPSPSSPPIRGGWWFARSTGLCYDVRLAPRSRRLAFRLYRAP